MKRNLSVNAYFRKLAAGHNPQYRFSGSSRQDWQKWQKELLPAIKATLGRVPEKVPLNPEILTEWQEEYLIKTEDSF
ncbi:MAG: hypothetical protein GWP14_00740 [Actinobacteria bacterium]|nr:hypothetical protein [Actinomycetota bacterium]